MFLEVRLSPWATGSEGSSDGGGPNFSDWLQGWGTVAGAAVGFLAAVAAGLLLWFEWRQARRQQKVRHAEHVTWYLREKVDGDERLRVPVDAGQFTGEPLPREIASHTDAVLVIVNSSGSTVYRGAVSIRAFQEPAPREQRYLSRRALGTVPPGQIEFIMPIWGYRSPGSSATREFAELADNRLVEYLQFRDPAGQLWRRLGNGRLIEVPDDMENYPDYST